MVDDELWTHLHVMMENKLVELRDHGVSTLGFANGLVVRYRDGSPSDAIRIPTRWAVEMVVEEYRSLVKAGRVANG